MFTQTNSQKRRRFRDVGSRNSGGTKERIRQNVVWAREGPEECEFNSAATGYMLCFRWAHTAKSTPFAGGGVFTCLSSSYTSSAEWSPLHSTLRLTTTINTLETSTIPAQTPLSRNLKSHYYIASNWEQLSGFKTLIGYLTTK